MKKVLVIQNNRYEGLGVFGECDVKSIEFEVVNVDYNEDLPANLDGFGGLIILGGPQSVYDATTFSEVHQEKELAEEAMRAQLPVLGVCLGAQILADVLGSVAKPSGGFEVGWERVILSSDLREDKVIGELPSELLAFHWHGDVFTLPAGALSIGSSDATPVQGFVYGSSAYALLFHVEVTAPQISQMVRAFPGDLRKGGRRESEIFDMIDERLGDLRRPAVQAFKAWTSLVTEG